jgi:hypothetical protein
MAKMVVSINNVTSLHKFQNHMQVSAGMFTITMNQLNDTFGSAKGAVRPSFDSVSTIGRGEANFSDGHRKTSLNLY